MDDITNAGTTDADFEARAHGFAPTRTRTLFLCPHCGRDCGHTWETLGSAENNYEGLSSFYPLDAIQGMSISDQNSDENARGWAGNGTWAASRCQGCSKVAIWNNEHVVYPKVSSAPPAHPDMPVELLDLYNEARAVLSTSPRAAAALARAVLERLLKLVDQDASPKLKLDGRIQRVQKEVSASLGRMLDVIRHGGNQALHGADDSDGIVVLILDPGDTTIVDFFFESINDLVDELITKPRRRTELVDALPPDVLEGIRVRAHKQS